ncbi:MAG: His/Gly/Thr/Pro-type tRNA ligase C-terminal domain-containing protein, partial [Clostridia bacterium]
HMAIAPWQVYLCTIRQDDPLVREKSDALYKDLTAAGIEVLYDDRDASPGFKFSDCDLMGIPIRVVVSPRSLAAGTVEVQLRDGSLKENIPYAQSIKRLQEIVDQAINK